MRLPLFLAAVALLLSTAARADNSEPVSRTLWEVRIVNAVHGQIQVRPASGGAWATIGHVTRPAMRTASGFSAARWARRGTVAAVAVHGIRIKIGDGENPALVSLVPRQFAVTPDRYGGHVPGDSGIMTDIGAGQTLFREWAPITGSPVSVELGASTVPLPADYEPRAGDVLRISAMWPENLPAQVVFENRKHGRITATYPDGRTENFGNVIQPLYGAGRFDGTSYTGPGQVNTNHPGVLTIGTAPVVWTDKSEGSPPERRGGFMIQPIRHVEDDAEGAPQVMGVAAVPDAPGWEGRFPLFYGAIGLADGALTCDVSIDDGAWQPLPVIAGKDDVAFGPAALRTILGRPVEKGLTAIRLRWPSTVPDIGPAYRAVLVKTTPEHEPTGIYDPVPKRLELGVPGSTGPVQFTVDGALRAVSNDPAFQWQWDTITEAPGRHWIETRGELASGRQIHNLWRVWVAPSHP